jgi:hypothetical protein
MGLVDKLVGGIFAKPQPIATRSDLADFMDSRAAFLAQKCVVEFCRVRAGVYWQKLFSEKEFQAELDLSRWRAYPPAFAMVAEMVEGSLREAAGIRQRHLPERLTALAKEVFSRYPVPAGEEPAFWTFGLGLVEEQLAKTQGGSPRPVREMPKPMARAVFNVLPMHKDIVTNDYDYIFNNLRMNLLRAHEDFIKAADLRAVADGLLGAVD